MNSQQLGAQMILQKLLLTFIFINAGFSSLSDWTELKTGCYKFGQKALTWEEAQAHCLADEAKIVEIETAEENSALTAEILRQGLDGKRLLFWLGLIDIDGTLPKNWVRDSTKEKLGWKGEWARGEGETRGENCAFLWASSAKPRVRLGSWHDISCRSKGFPFADTKIQLSLAALCKKKSCSAPRIEDGNNTNTSISEDKTEVNDGTTIICSLVI